MKTGKARGGDKRKASGKGWIFLAVVVLLYGLMLMLDIDRGEKVAATFTRIVTNILPALLLVFVLIFLSSVLLTPEKVRSYVGASSGIKGWMLSLLSGVLSTGPVYAWYALLGDLVKQGMKRSLVSVFLYSRAVKLPLLPMLAHYFGPGYVIVLSFYLIVFSVVNGFIMDALDRRGKLVDRPAT